MTGGAAYTTLVGRLAGNAVPGNCVWLNSFLEIRIPGDETEGRVQTVSQRRKTE